MNFVSWACCRLHAMKTRAAALLGLAAVAGLGNQEQFLAYHPGLHVDFLADFEPASQTGDFSLQHVVSGRDARMMSLIRDLSGETVAGFEMTLLRVPERIQTSLPSHRIRYTSGRDSSVSAFLRDPAAYDSSAAAARAMPRVMPRPDDHETVKNFAFMCSNAYILHSIVNDWRNMTDWNQVWPARSGFPLNCSASWMTLAGTARGCGATSLPTRRGRLSS